MDATELAKKMLEWQESQAKADVLKMDIEGAEYLILKDRPAWLQRVRVLLAEFHGAHQAEMIQWLRESGFQLEIDGSQITVWRHSNAITPTFPCNT
jgi:hypothetical protein